MNNLPPAARYTDPSSSHAAAIAFEKSGKRVTHTKHAALFVLMYPGLTCRELAQRLGLSDTTVMDRHDLTRRLPDAVKLGLIKKGDIRTCAVGHRAALTWWPVEDESE